MTKRPSLFAAKATQSDPVETKRTEALPDIVEGPPAKPRRKARLVGLFEA
jgi:hypothetical protein